MIYICPNGVVDHESSLDVAQGAPCMGRLTSFDEPGLCGSVICVQQDHRMWVSPHWTHMGEYIQRRHVVDDEGGVLQGIDAHQIAIVIVEDEFEL